MHVKPRSEGSSQACMYAVLGYLLSCYTCACDHFADCHRSHSARIPIGRECGSRGTHAGTARPRSFHVTSPVSGTTYSVFMRRALTSRQAAAYYRTGRLFASRRCILPPIAAGAGGDMDSEGCSDDELDRLGSLGKSHPISVPASGRTSDTGAGSDAGSSVLGGVTPLPPRPTGEAWYWMTCRACGAVDVMHM